MALEEALDRFAQVDPQGATLVKLRYFVGMTMTETADSLNLPKPSAERDLKLLLDVEARAQDAGWPKQSTLRLGLFKVWARDKAGELDNAGDAFLEIGSSEEADFTTWSAATIGAGSVSNSAGYTRLRCDGIARFASNVEGEEAYRFLSAVLLHPLSEDMVAIANQVLERVLKGPSWRKHWIL